MVIRAQDAHDAKALCIIRLCDLDGRLEFAEVVIDLAWLLGAGGKLFNSIANVPGINTSSNTPPLLIESTAILGGTPQHQDWRSSRSTLFEGFGSLMRRFR
jgi:hypothetical protein